jgi:hypothetical protein
MKNVPAVLILLGWGVLLAAATLTVRVCMQNAPQEVPLDPAPVVSETPSR